MSRAAEEKFSSAQSACDPYDVFLFFLLLPQSRRVLPCQVSCYCWAKFQEHVFLYFTFVTGSWVVVLSRARPTNVVRGFACFRHFLANVLILLISFEAYVFIPQFHVFQTLCPCSRALPSQNSPFRFLMSFLFLNYFSFFVYRC